MSKEKITKNKFILPMKFNLAYQKYEPDFEKIKEIGDSLKEKIKKFRIKK